MTELHFVYVLLGIVLLPIVIMLCRSTADSTDPKITRLSWDLTVARRLRPRRRVVELHVSALSRARGSGGWSVEVVFDGADRERLQLGSGSPCEREFADALVDWGERAAKGLHVMPNIVSGSDC